MTNGDSDTVTVKAPSSTANLGPGFDVFGLALDAYYDVITATKNKKKRAAVTITSQDDIPTKPNQNTAGLVAQAMIKKFRPGYGVCLHIQKGVPAGFGMGSSAASAAGAAVAINLLFGLGLDDSELTRFAGAGEAAAAGTVHYDNVAAAVAGGFVIVKDGPKITKIDPPKKLRMCVAIPAIEVPRQKTMVSRRAVPKRVAFGDSIQNLANASCIVAGMTKKDPRMIGESVRDVIVEPARKQMIPGFDRVKTNAQRAGAFGVTISGAGPSVIAFANDEADMEKIGAAMSKGFTAATKAKPTIVICRPDRHGAVRV